MLIYLQNRLTSSVVLPTAYFLILFLLGITIVSDYPITIDERVQRIHSLVTAKYLAGIISPEIQSLPVFNDIPQIDNYPHRFYGVTFQLPLVAAEIIFKLSPQNKEVWLIRHFAVFCLFFLANICFYKLLLMRLGNYRWALCASFLLCASPRIFVDSFFNIKDSVFLSLFIISIYYGSQFLRFRSWNSLLKFTLIAALATNSRIIGIILPLAISMFLLCEMLIKSNKSLKASYRIHALLIIQPILILALWPATWSGLDVVTEAFVLSKNYVHWYGKFLFFGEFVESNNTPWFYMPVWILISMPIVVIIGSFIGAFKVIKDWYSLIKIKTGTEQRQLVDSIIFLLLTGCLLLVMLIETTLYSGWRHFYFLAPLIIYLSVIGFYEVQIFLTKHYGRFFSAPCPIKVLSNSLLFLIVLGASPTIYWMCINHPLQNYYFNSFAGSQPLKNFDPGTWSTTDRLIIDFLIKKGKEITLAYDRNIASNLAFYKKSDRKLIKLVSEDSSEYLVKRYHGRKASLNWHDLNYTSIKKIIINGTTTAEIFKLNKVLK